MARPFLVISLFVVSPVLGELVQVLQGDPVKFPPPPKCRTGEEAALIHRLRDDSSRLVASCPLNQDWKPGPDYSDRINQSASVVLSAANLNDHGLYEFTCKQRIVKHLQLDVLVPFEAHVSAGGTVRLPCYTVTAGESVQSVRWERHGELVLQRRSTESGKDSEERRVSVSADWHRTGDLSLTMEPAQPGDRGVYFCYFYSNGQKRRGNPAAVRLEVPQRVPEPPARTPPPPPQQQQSECHTGTTIITTVTVMAVLFVPLIAFLGWKLKSRGFETNQPEQKNVWEGGEDRGEEGSGQEEDTKFNIVMV
ncbi:uncharacterized protein LOC114435420 [Parambassis ranga]|uniref:Uncharacterized protein LOC114435420 n=1 Tax=Parambassis ranga TaxID=210632 RepID=A0A6P7HYX4_9TELE|nr:uncharacterized protein LOC114435420 [Parambassis ranga]